MQTYESKYTYSPSAKIYRKFTESAKADGGEAPMILGEEAVGGEADMILGEEALGSEAQTIFGHYEAEQAAGGEAGLAQGPSHN